MPTKKLKDHTAREAKRRRIMGPRGKAAQDRRKHSLTGSKAERTKQSTREAIRRVGEYKKAKKQDFPGANMSGGGLCRGGGAATRGMRYNRSG
jgi:hypothetical protein